jgi:S1-C subfamily serine protease
VQALGRLNVPAIDLGAGLRIGAGDKVVIAAEGGRRHAIAATVVARQEFAGHWEYLLDRAIFTAPAHPFWGGAGLIAADGSLIGIGSLHVQRSNGRELRRDVNMVVPIDLLPPIIDDLLTYGRPNRPPRPWLGLYAAEIEDENAVVVAGMSERGPAIKSGLKPGDRILAVRDDPVSSLASFWRRVWASGAAGCDVVLQIQRDKDAMTVRVPSADRTRLLKAPRLH